jgi:hypothetical protein
MEDGVHIRIASISVLVLALTLCAAPPAAAQGELGAGISFLNGEGDSAVGVTVDYSSLFRTIGTGGLGWVADFSLHNNGDAEVRITTFMGGVRYSQQVNDRLTWFGQGLLGLGHLSATGDQADFCDEFDLDCSDNEFAFTPGAGVNVPVGPRLSVRAQIDFVTLFTEGESFNVRRFWFGVSLPLGGNP